MVASMSEFIAELRAVSKSYDGQKALQNINIQIGQSEFVALLGPSGCGKSTTLRVFAGFERIDSGEIRLNGKAVSKENYTPPEKREIGMVFQDLALFPHLSVAENIGFALKGNKKVRQERVNEMLELVGLAGLGNQMPHMLSGGQQQRVAVARALASRPNLILMDEPFSSLDAQLRVQLRWDIREILKREGVSVLLVTHDQNEAFSFADRIVMMNQGEIIQSGSPQEIYNQPENCWVASFVGGANFIPAIKDEMGLQTEVGRFDKGGDAFCHRCQLMVRPEDIEVKPANQDTYHGVIKKIDFLGNRGKLTIETRSGLEVVSYSNARQNWQHGDLVTLECQHTHVIHQPRLRTPNNLP